MNHPLSIVTENIVAWLQKLVKKKRYFFSRLIEAEYSHQGVDSVYGFDCPCDAKTNWRTPRHPNPHNASPQVLDTIARVA